MNGIRTHDLCDTGAARLFLPQFKCMHMNFHTYKVLLTNGNIKFKVVTAKKKAEKRIKLHQIILFFGNKMFLKSNQEEMEAYSQSAKMQTSFGSRWKLLQTNISLLLSTIEDLKPSNNFIYLHYNKTYMSTILFEYENTTDSKKNNNNNNNGNGNDQER